MLRPHQYTQQVARDRNTAALLVVRVHQSCTICVIPRANCTILCPTQSGEREPLHLTRLLDITAPSHMTRWHPHAARHACLVNFHQHGCRENYLDNQPHECTACEGKAPSSPHHGNPVTWHCQEQTCSIPTAEAQMHMGHLYLQQGTKTAFQRF
jgi:hypothetical protein